MSEIRPDPHPSRWSRQTPCHPPPSPHPRHSQAIAFFVLVLVPVGLTLMFTFTNLEFQRAGASATVTVRRYLLMFIPWQTQQIPQVKQLRPHITPSKTYRNNHGEKINRIGTGQVAVVSGGPEVIVPVAPELAKALPAQFDQFLATTATPAPVKTSVYANWSLSYIVGGIATFWCAFYIAGVVVSLVRMPFK